jgi:hypothetical protein
MPFVSQAQEGWAHEHPDKFGRKNLAEWDAATKGKKLPKRKKPRMAEAFEKAGK